MTPHVKLNEWEVCLPEPGSPTHGLRLHSDHDLAAKLNNTRKIEILELINGVEIRATSWVGWLNLDELTIAIQPKIAATQFLHLLRYAYNLRSFTLFDQLQYGNESRAFQDLIVHQLVSEVRELIERGLHRDYTRKGADLSCPKGRIDFQNYAVSVARKRATIPCVHHPRTYSIPLNRLIKTGLHLAAQATTDVGLRSELHRLNTVIEIDETAFNFSSDEFNNLLRSIDRRTRAYVPSLQLIRLLHDGFGFSWSDNNYAERTPGFLFDMNRFFQSLLYRFLNEYLRGFSIIGEQNLTSMFAYAANENPRSKSAPNPRPDFMIFKGDKVVRILDAKYRDLWVKDLPVGMLYQLTIYALNNNASDHESVILYPTLVSGSKEQVIVVNDPLKRVVRARVVLRPVDMAALEELISNLSGDEQTARCVAFARQLVFGKTNA